MNVICRYMNDLALYFKQFAIASVYFKHVYYILMTFLLPEYKTVLYQSGYPVYHHSAGCQAHWQSHHQQSHSEDW